MRQTFILIIISIVAVKVSGQDFKDLRDGQTYKTIEIGKQIWMAENLKYKTTGSFCFDNIKEYCDTFGYLYTYKAATKACPAGWHLPSRVEFMTLINQLGGEENAGKMLIEGGDSGFNAKFGGDYTSDNDFFYGIGRNVSFWSSTVANAEDAFTMQIAQEDLSITVYQNLFANGYYVRCVKNQ